MKHLLFYFSEYSRLAAKGHTPYYCRTEALRVTEGVFDILDYTPRINEAMSWAHKVSCNFFTSFLLNGEKVEVKIVIEQITLDCHVPIIHQLETI